MGKATITNADKKSEPIECQFNPSEYVIAKANNWSQRHVVGKNVPALTFAGGGGRTLTLELFFDVNEKENGDVRKIIDKLWQLTMTDPDIKNPKTGKARPPLVIFQWGPDWSFKAAITSLSVRYTLFRSNGMPVRAVASVTFQEGDAEVKKQNPTSASSQPGRKRREVRPHDTLALIAYEEYGDAAKWRVIASENDVEDPMHLVPGTVLSIPPADLLG